MLRVTQLGSARSLLLTVLGEFVHPNGSPVWTATLVDALQVLGVEEKAARQALTRTAAEGMLSSERHGRRVLWSLTAQGHALLEDGTRRIYGFMRERRPWDGRWLVVSVPIPETQRQLRHRLRTRLSWLGLGSPTSGLWITTDATKDDEVHAVVRDLGLADLAFAWTGSASGLGEEGRLLAEAWDLEEVEDRYVAFLSEFEKHLAKIDWLALGRPTIADVACYPYVGLAPEGDIPLSPYPAIRAWCGRVERLPGYTPMPGLPVAA